MKVVFLDINGVMRPGRCYFKPKTMSLYQRLLYTITRRNKLGGFDPLAIAAINRLYEKTGAAVVINSTWSIDGLRHVRRLLRNEGLKARVIGMTAFPGTANHVYTRPEAIETRHLVHQAAALASA